jgi:hypothetical protein
MTASQRIAIAAHMHVLLRRKTGRVTDTEWMAENLDYALEIVRYARARAAEDSVPELQEWADKLERAALEPRPDAKAPLVQAAVKALRDRPVVAAAAPVATQPGELAPASGFAASTFGGPAFGESAYGAERPPGVPKPPRDPDAPRYVGGIR